MLTKKLLAVVGPASALLLGVAVPRKLTASGGDVSTVVPHGGLVPPGTCLRRSGIRRSSRVRRLLPRRVAPRRVAS